MSRSKNTLPAKRRASSRPYRSLRYPRDHRTQSPPMLVLFDANPPRSFHKTIAKPAAVHNLRKMSERQARAQGRLALNAALGAANSMEFDPYEIEIAPIRHRGSAVWFAT